MAPAAKPKGMLSGFISDDEDDSQFMESTMPDLDSAVENHAPNKKARGRPKGATNKATKTKSTKPAKPATTNARTTKKREPLTDKTNETPASDSEDEKTQQEDSIMTEAMSGDELDDSIPPTKKPKATKTKRETPAKSSSVAPSPPRREAPKKKAGKSKKQASPSPEPEPESESEEEEEEEIEETMPFVAETQAASTAPSSPEEAPKPTRKEATKPARSESRIRSSSRTAPPSRKRAASASDTERNDPAVRRKLGEANKKLESLEFKYRNLREIGVRQAEENFDALRTQSETKTKAANELIAALKSELKESKSELKESKGEIKEAKSADKEVLKLGKALEGKDAEITRLQAEMEELNVALRESQAENKNLATKLAASRSAAASVESASARVPGSAKKGAAVRMVGSAEAAQAASAAMLKEHLYGDLTGLVILSVKSEDGEDVYDCIQTGRNGTLHFKFAITTDAESYEDAQCSYMPQLEPSRDKELMALLPEYLVDQNHDIAFPRPQASKFYARVVKSLSERLE